MKNKMIAALAAMAATAALALAPIGADASPSPAPPDAGINAHFGTLNWGWYFADSPQNELDYQYKNYPVPCNESPTGAAWVVLWVYPQGGSSAISQTARDAVARASSIFPASANKQVSTWAQVRSTSYAPRWETSGVGDGVCGIQFNAIPIPANVWQNDRDCQFGQVCSYDYDGVNGMGTYLKSVGANQPNRKYLILRSTMSGSHSDGVVFSDYFSDARPGSNNSANGTSQSYVTPDGTTFGTGLYIAHEMTHAMGAVITQSSNNNTQNSGHPKDCGDIMCYGGGTPGETYNNGCGTIQNFNNNASLHRFRLDCNKDGYFAPGAAWTATQWAASSSAYLWGNTSPASFPADAATGSMP